MRLWPLLSAFLHLARGFGEKTGKMTVTSSSTPTMYFDDWYKANSVPSSRPEQKDLDDALRRKDMNGTARSRTSREDLSTDGQANQQRRLIEELFDPIYYERNVHPVRDHTKPVRINVSMSLYQILEVDEHSQSLTVNVWMVQEWFDEFINWDPHEFGNLSKTIIPHNQIFIPDTYLYNSETLEQKKTESLMNAIVETGHWENRTGAYVQLLFPAIYKLSCKMNVRFFPYDRQNCTLRFSSWTHDMGTIDYWPKMQASGGFEVNLKNMVRNEEWDVVSFEFERFEAKYNCCEIPWAMLHAHLIIKRKPLYYIVNLVIPTSIITIVAVTGFFTPTSSSSERDEKLYLGINTLLTMSIMMLMVCNQMPSTSTYVPLMSWYYMGIIGVIVVGSLLATLVLAIHGQKHYQRPLSKGVRNCVHNWFVNDWILEVPTQLIELWMEYGIVDASRTSTDDMDPILADHLDPVSHLPPDPTRFFRQISTEVSNSSVYSYERRLASITRQYTLHLKKKSTERQRQLNNNRGSGKNAREVKRQKLMRRCSLEWEYLANVLDRILLTFFIGITILFFALLVFFDDIFNTEVHIEPPH